MSPDRTEPSPNKQLQRTVNGVAGDDAISPFHYGSRARSHGGARPLTGRSA